MGSSIDAKIIEIVQRQDSRWTVVELTDGNRYRMFDAAWGYDLGDDWAHVTTNISPRQEGASEDFFHTSDVKRLVDEESGGVLFDIDRVGGVGEE